MTRHRVPDRLQIVTIISNESTTISKTWRSYEPEMVAVVQQYPAMGRGTAVPIAYGEYRAMDLSAFNSERVEQNQSFDEKTVI